MKNCKIFDTSAMLIIIYQAKFPQILKIIADEGYHILIPKEVYREIREDFRIIGELLKDGKIDLLPTIDEDKLESMRKRHPSFGDGEISVLLSCQDGIFKGDKCRCIIDDMDAKKFAKQNKIEVSGVIGLLLWLKKLGKINKDECSSIHMALKQNPRLPKDILGELIK